MSKLIENILNTNTNKNVVASTIVKTEKKDNLFDDNSSPEPN